HFSNSRFIMTQLMRLNFFALSASVLLMVPGCSEKKEGAAASPSGSAPSSAAVATPESSARRNVEETQGLVLLRGLPTLGTSHSIAIVELNPEAANFGAILQDFDLPNLKLPLHHLYYSPNGRLYATCLDPKSSLNEISLSRNATGAAVINGIKPVDTGGEQVGEDIIWHT